MTDKAILISDEELDLRLTKVRKQMTAAGMDAMLVSDNINKFYLTGRVFMGYIYLDATRYVLFVKRPTVLTGPQIRLIRKPEQIADEMDRLGIARPMCLGLELSQGSYAEVMRLAKALQVDRFEDADRPLSLARMVKTPAEISAIRYCGEIHKRVYSLIPRFYYEGMSDVELQIEIERAARKAGSIGIMRTSGHELEINMGNVITGENADTPSPYDFAMGGAGTSPALPSGANGTLIKPGMPVMVDVNGCFNGYMTDMTRTYAQFPISAEVERANSLSIAICNRLAEMGIPGASCADMYNEAVKMASEAGMADYFMGHHSQASFVGHGVGITINELPVLHARSREVLERDMVIALEPKFVLPHIGAVGIENTYVVTDEGMEVLTHAPERIVELEP